MLNWNTIFLYIYFNTGIDMTYSFSVLNNISKFITPLIVFYRRDVWWKANCTDDGAPLCQLYMFFVDRRWLPVSTESICTTNFNLSCVCLEYFVLYSRNQTNVTVMTGSSGISGCWECHLNSLSPSVSLFLSHLLTVSLSILVIIDSSMLF